MTELPTLAILAGGLATRLRKVAPNTPKSLVSVAGEPFLAHQLALAHRQGFRRVVLLIGHLGDMIRDFVGDGQRFGLQVDYCADGDRQLGTGGALQAALPWLGPQFFVLYGDSYLNVAVEPIWRAYLDSGLPALMTVLHNCNRWDMSNVVFDGQKVLSHDKSNRGEPGVEWIDYGLSIFSASCIADWPVDAPFDLSEVTKRLAQDRQLKGLKVSQRFYEIGTETGVAEADAYLKATKVKQ